MTKKIYINIDRRKNNNNKKRKNISYRPRVRVRGKSERLNKQIKVINEMKIKIFIAFRDMVSYYFFKEVESSKLELSEFELLCYRNHIEFRQG